MNPVAGPPDTTAPEAAHTTHFDELDASGFTEPAIGNLFESTSADLIGDVDEYARTALSRDDFVNFLSPMPQG